MRQALAIFALSLVLSGGGIYYLTSSAEVDAVAEVVADAGVEPAAAPSAPAVVPPVIKDPTDDASGYAKDVSGAFKAGQYALLVVLCLFGLARVLLMAAAKWNIAWLTKATPVLVTASAALASIGASLSAGGDVDYRAVLGAMAMVVALYLSPSGPKTSAVEQGAFLDPKGRG